MVTITRLRRKPTAAGVRALNEDTSSALDKVFFQRNPHRQYRARLSTPQELNKLAANNAMPPIPDPSMLIWTCVKQVYPGFRLRNYRAAAVPPWLTHDVGERIARVMFESKEGNYE
jgi:hypothetical protein